MSETKTFCTFEVLIEIEVFIAHALKHKKIKKSVNTVPCSQIPKIIHYCWLGEAPYPILVEKCIQSWRKKLPDYTFMCWNTVAFDVNSLVWTKQAFETKKFAFASDYIRLYSLYHHGGIYLDADVEVLTSFDPFLHHKSFTGWERSGVLEAAVIGAQKGTSWLKHCMSYYEKNEFIKPDGSYNTLPAPVVYQKELQKICKTYSFQKASDCILHLEDICLDIYPYSYFSPKNQTSLKIEKKEHSVCVHHFNGDWIPKNFRYYLKIYIHKSLLFLFGAKIHSNIVDKIRKKKLSL